MAVTDWQARYERLRADVERMRDEAQEIIDSHKRLLCPAPSRVIGYRDRLNKILADDMTGEADGPPPDQSKRRMKGTTPTAVIMDEVDEVRCGGSGWVCGSCGGPTGRGGWICLGKNQFNRPCDRGKPVTAAPCPGCRDCQPGTPPEVPYYQRHGFKCPHCGATLEMTPDEKVATCPNADCQPGTARVTL